MDSIQIEYGGSEKNNGGIIWNNMLKDDFFPLLTLSFCRFHPQDEADFKTGEIISSFLTEVVLALKEVWYEIDIIAICYGVHF